MVNIKLDENYTLVGDTNQWIILKDGRSNWFYTTLQSALSDWLLNECPKKSKAESIEQLIEYMKASETRLNKVLTSSKIGDKNKMKGGIK